MLAVLVLVGVPVPAGADEAGTGNGAVAATGPCEAGWVFDAAANECSQRQTQPADVSCRDAVGTRAVTLSGNDCVTTSAHTTLPTYTCDAAEEWALVGGDPPSCQRTVSREVSTTVTVTDMVHFAESYQHRVEPVTRTYMGMETYTYTARVRVAPFTERVRVAPFTRTYTAMETYTYTARVRYCAQYDTEFGTGCVRWAYRDETRTGVRETLITEPAYNYEDRDVFNYRDETRTGVRETLITEPAYNYEDRDVFNYETRTRQVCCRPVTTEVTTTETVTDTESGVPGAECTAAGYTMSSASVCSQPAGVRLQGATYECDTGWAAAAGDPTTCERTATGTPEWECPADHTLDAATTPPHCHLQQQPQDPEEGTDAQTCSTTSLGTLGTGRVTRPGSWAAGCRSTQLGSDQTPYWAQSFTFAVAGAATADLDVTSSGDPYVFVINSSGTAVGSDDDSGTDGRDSRIRGLRLPRGSYTIEATTSGPRQTGSFALALDLTVTVPAPQPGVTVPAPQPGVTISGLAAADGTPQAGAATAGVTDQFNVTPADALCTAEPAGATIVPDAGGTRFLTHSVPAGTNVLVRVRCTKDTQTDTASDTATARFTANAAPVAITGLGHAVGTPASGAATAEVTHTFDVAPTDAVCTAEPAGATIAPDTGRTRTLTHSVPAGTNVLVRVTCTSDTQTGTAVARFTANPDPATTDCDSSLDTFSAAGTPVRGTISSDDGCTSVRRRPNNSSVYHARRHFLRLTSPGWVTVTLESAASNPQRLDTYLILLRGDAPDGSGAKITHNDDARNASSHGLHRHDSRIADRFLQTGTYTIEATTFRSYSATHPQRSTGDYILRVSVDHTPRAADQPAELRVENGNSIIRTWAYGPGAATVAIASAFPEGITANITRYPGAITRQAGRATLTATADRVGSHDIDITYTNGPATLTKATTITSYCPSGRTETSTGTCIPNSATLPTGCAPTVLHGGNYWGRHEHNGQYRLYSADADVDCDSLTHSDRAVYYAFSLPKRLPVRLGLRDAINMATMRAGGAPSVTVWSVTSTHPATGRVVEFIATAAPALDSGPLIGRSLDAGAYLIEIAPSRPVSRAFEDNWYKLRSDVPTGAKTHADVQQVGNTGLSGAGMSLGRFLDARGSLIYGAHPDADPAKAGDPFYPSSPSYPWLPFTTDRCSIPPSWILHLAENAIDEAAIRLGPLGWLAAHFLVPNADEIQDHAQFGGVTVSFVYGCMRHDFNWRNLHRVNNHLGYDTTAGTWNGTVRSDADTRLGTDLYGLCNANQDETSESSSYHTWTLPNRGAIDR